MNEQAKNLRVVVVDDNQASAQTTAWMLEIFGAEVKIALDGDEAIEVAKSYEPRLMLVDINLPKKNGYEVCAHLKEQEALKDTVFIAQTGWDDEEHRRRSREAGFHHHLVKPVQMERLKSIVTSLSAAA